MAIAREGTDVAKTEKSPALVARCHTTADVVDAVNLGREQAARLAIRAGGHDVPGKDLTESGLTIDLAPMKGVRVDHRRWRVWAQAGVTWREYNRTAGLHGLATTGAVDSSTGIAGHTLAGGEGWLMGRYGLTIDNLLAVELVTADGQVRTASAEENEDLFWALRGGGGKFGVATAFEYRAHPVSTVTGGTVAHPAGDGLDALDFYREFTSTARDELTVFFGLVDAGDGSGEKLVTMSLCHCGADLEQVDSDLAPLRKFGSPVMDNVRLMPYPVINTLGDDGHSRGAFRYRVSAFVRELSDAAMEVMAESFRQCPSALSHLTVAHYHGAVTRVAPTATAFPHRDPGYHLLIAGQWLDRAETETNIAWAGDTLEALRPHLADPGSADSNEERLLKVKRRYDPDNAFGLNP
jgi:FAD/FMN-containing dehydrogenase